MSEHDGPVVLDASAVLAFLFDEAGADAVRSFLPTGIIGVVNLAEVLTKLSDRSIPMTSALLAMSRLGLDTRPMTVDQAQRAADMRAKTRVIGLSLGDRACLSLAAELGLPAATADRSWAGIAADVNVTIHLIR